MSCKKCKKKEREEYVDNEVSKILKWMVPLLVLGGLSTLYVIYLLIKFIVNLF